MDRAEYWILDSVVDGMRLFGTLHPAVVQEAFNRPGHGLGYDQLLDLLNCLFQSGDLVANRVSLLNYEDSRLFVPARAELAGLFTVTGDSDVFYGLTAQGGARWEAVSAPDWNGFSDCWWTEPDWWGAVGADRRRVEQYLLSAQVQARVVPGSEFWEVVRPWQATYWKSLPIAHKVSFRITESEEAMPWAAPAAGWYKNYMEYLCAS